MAHLSTGQVFMSYSRRDEAVMRRVTDFLRGQGIKIWVDNEKLVPGTPVWEEAIEKAVSSCHAVVVLCSPDSKSSEWVRREVTLADQHNKRVFPILMRGSEATSISLRLTGRQYVDIRQNEEARLNSLAKALLSYLEKRSGREKKPGKVVKKQPSSSSPIPIATRLQAIWGFDISAYDNIDWSRVKNAGTNFVFVRASNNTLADSAFAAYWQEAKRVGIPRGAWHVFHPKHDNAIQQANVFMSILSTDKGELPPVLDVEPITDSTRKDITPTGDALTSQMKIWLDTVEAAFGRKPMIYTNATFVKSYKINASWLQNYPLWLAQYPLKPGTQTMYFDPNDLPSPSENMPQQLSGFQPWSFWQYSDTGKIDGINNVVDMDIFNGSFNDFFKFLQIH